MSMEFFAGPCSLEEAADTGFDLTQDAYTIESVLKEIECYVSYLEDAPDEKLTPYEHKFGSISERLRKLDEYLSKLKNAAKA